MAGSFTEYMQQGQAPVAAPPAPAPVMSTPAAMPQPNPQLGAADPIMRLLLQHIEQQQKLAKAQERYQAGRMAARMIFGQR